VPLSRGADPVIEGLVLPERPACAAEDLVGFAGGRAFEVLRDFGERRSRLDERVDVVGHDDVGAQVEKLSLVQVLELALHTRGDGWFFQPHGAGLGAVQ